MNPLSVQLYTVRDLIGQDRRGVLTRIAQMGYGAVEPFEPLNDPAGFRAITDELGLKVSSTHAPVLGEDRDAIFEAARTLGTDTVILPHSDPERWKTREGIEGVAADLSAVVPQATDLGLRIGYHNHWFELENRIDGKPALEIFADQLAPQVVLEVDTYWAQVGGVDVPELLKRLGDRVRFLHVKDGPATAKQPMTAVGQGVMPVKEILAANSTVEWHVVELDSCATDMMEALAESAKYLNSGAVR